MAGHSKWKNIMHKKGKTDAQRAKIFSKIGKEISIAIRDGGADPNSNAKLRDLITKAKSLNVPNDNIERIIKKAEGGDGEQYEVVIYEGYGIGGVAVIVEAATDNRNRTAGDVRHYFDKYGGNLGTTGCVSFMFSDKGVIVVEAPEVDEDTFLEDALESGVEHYEIEDGIIEIHTELQDLEQIHKSLEEKGYKIVSSEPDKIPSTYTALTDQEQIERLQKMLEMLEDNDDVTNIWHNWENEPLD